MAIKIDAKALADFTSLLSTSRVSSNPKIEQAANTVVKNMVAAAATPEPEPFVPPTMPAPPTVYPEGDGMTPEPEDMTADELYDELEAENHERFVREMEAKRERERARIPERLVDLSFPWDDSQTEAIVGLARVQSGCLIGAAGTGKTTCEKRLVDILIHGDESLGVAPMNMQQVDIQSYWDRGAPPAKSDEEQAQRIVPSVLLCAYTGQATQNIKKNFPKSWHGNIHTIHSALGYYPETYEVWDPESQKQKTTMRFVPFYTKFIKMPWDVIIMDEASMTNIDLWHQLLDASKPTTRFYFIGDINQLPPPVGQGVLGFAMSRLPVFELRHIHRQKEAAANRIIETAWDILQGKGPKYDDPRTNPDWRVLGYELPAEVTKSAQQVVSIALALREKKIKVIEQQKDGSLVENPNYPIYDPWRDRILTCMNGYNPNDPNSAIGQAPLNDWLSLFLSNKQERTIIDAGRETKRFCVGYRVMATKNESPSTKDRITNGMTGIITDIQVNEKFTGDRRFFGLESAVAQARKEALEPLSDKDFEFDEAKIDLSQKDERVAGQSSHLIFVDFNGIHRVFATKIEVESLQIAYASTVHKTQGSEMDTAIVIIHHAQKRMLCRESFYTAVTRATKRLIILYTPHGIRLALAKQKIFGSTIQEKVRQYLALVTESVEGSPANVKVRLTHSD